MVWCDMVVCYDVRFGMLAWYGMMWYVGMVWYDMIWYGGMISWYDMIWYGGIVWSLYYCQKHEKKFQARARMIYEKSGMYQSKMSTF